MRKNTWWLPLLLVAGLVIGWMARDLAPAGPTPPPLPGAGSQARLPATDAGLPAEALRTIALIRSGGPFPHRQDGGVFGNREGLLPEKPRGWYHEYTVQTPGLSHRGARRIVTGGNPPREWYYTQDHYRSFRRIEEGP